MLIWAFTALSSLIHEQRESREESKSSDRSIFTKSEEKSTRLYDFFFFYISVSEIFSSPASTKEYLVWPYCVTAELTCDLKSCLRFVHVHFKGHCLSFPGEEHFPRRKPHEHVSCQTFSGLIFAPCCTFILVAQRCRHTHSFVASRAEVWSTCSGQVL